MNLKLFGVRSLFSLLLATLITQSMALPVRAAEDEITKEETASAPVAKNPEWQSAVQTRYDLKPEQMQKMRDAGLTNPQMAIVAELSKQSGRSIDDIIKMRQEQKMGWGQIAHELNLPPGSIGHAVSDLRKGLRDERAEKKAEKKEERREKRKDRREERKDQREERRSKREERKAERSEHQEAHGKSK
jgi:hypothetical protein